jgi:hypothetical protein
MNYLSLSSSTVSSLYSCISILSWIDSISKTCFQCILHRCTIPLDPQQWIHVSDCYRFWQILHILWFSNIWKGEHLLRYFGRNCNDPGSRNRLLGTYRCLCLLLSCGGTCRALRTLSHLWQGAGRICRSLRMIDRLVDLAFWLWWFLLLHLCSR